MGTILPMIAGKSSGGRGLRVFLNQDTKMMDTAAVAKYYAVYNMRFTSD